jgi:leucyl aminopeptidase
MPSRLGRLVMQANLPVRLVVLVAAVENAVSADAFRPGDILNSRKGLTIEIGNTDAEGRLILADVLTRAGEHSPDLTLDFATLTGAARIALGPELPPLYTDDEALAADLLSRRPPPSAIRSGGCRCGPATRRRWTTEIADLRNDSAAWAQAGSVTAALFLQKLRARPPAPGPIWTSSPGTPAPAPAGPRAARPRPCGPASRC